MTGVNGIATTVGWPRLIISIFVLSLFALCPIVGVNPQIALDGMVGRFGMNLVLVLSMIPMIQTGCGLNFGVPLGIVSGVLGAVLSIEFGFVGWVGLFAAVTLGIGTACLVGLLYGLILNRVKGDEMIIATYIGLAFIAFMNLFWVKFLPVKNPNLILAYGGEGGGMRQTVTLEGFWVRKFTDLFSFKIGKFFEVPTGMLLVGALCCLILWLFFNSKLGTAMTAVGSNPAYARASGINVNRMRIVSVMMSTAIAAIGIIIYAQDYTMLQLYNAPQGLMFPSVAAVLIGGATINKASIKNACIGTLLYQGVVTVGPMVVNGALADIAEPVRLIISNGMIIYALTRKERN
jgi:simple sugar transport system permease protein